VSILPPGAVVCSPQSIFGSKVFYLARGRRHWIREGRWFAEHDLAWPECVIDVDPRLLSATLPGGPAPRTWTDADRLSPPSHTSSFDMREIAGSLVHGRGIEVGAGASPYPLPLDCRVLYADRLPHSELTTEIYPGQIVEDLVEPDLITDLEALCGPPDGSLDFIVACHVIEHTRNPIGALVRAWNRLRSGGQLVLVIPDMERTFDRGRKVTLLEHLVADFEYPSRDRDLAHYQEFYRDAFPTPADRYDETVRARFDSDYAIHYHTWTYASFQEMIGWVRKEVAPFSDVWAQPTRPDPDADIEFYFVLTK
jgi:SAM-dependent methyltransferase